jgi:hypothetical protein
MDIVILSWELDRKSCLQGVRIMKRHVGLWIDHKKAVIVNISDEGQETKLIRSNLEKPARPPGSAHSKAGYQPEDQ